MSKASPNRETGASSNSRWIRVGSAYCREGAVKLIEPPRGICYVYIID